MKTLKCPDCDRTQKTGKFCLDCGAKLNEVITSHISFKRINSKRSSDHLKRNVRSWLTRIGVQNSDIKISSSAGTVTIEYVLNNIMYSFSSHLQDSITNNIAAVEQFLHHRVLGIERGIESIEQAFKGYESLPDYTGDKNFNPYTVLGFEKGVTLEEARSRFKEQVKKYHPDVNDSDFAKEQFQRIKKAMDIIEAEVKK